MSVIVAIKDKVNDIVRIGCDSQVTRGYSKSTLSNPSNFKIFRPADDKDIIIGLVGYLRDRDILYCVENWIDKVDKLSGTKIDYRYIVKKIVPRIFSEFRASGMIPENKQKAEADSFKGELIFVYKNDIYKISGDGTVIAIDDYVAIGSGTDWAMGYLNNMIYTDCPNQDKNYCYEVLATSIRSVCKSDLHVGHPIIMMNSEDGEIDIIMEDGHVIEG